MRAQLLLALGAALVAAGCVSVPPPEVAPVADDVVAAPTLPVLDLVATGCKEGGGHSVHPKEWAELPKPWVPADIMSDVGPRALWSEVPGTTLPEEGNTFGNWHSTVICESMTYRGRSIEPAFFGYVGERIEKPSFDAPAAAEPDHHYLVTVIAVADDELLHALIDGGIMAMKAVPGWEVLPGGVERITMTTDHNGAYQSIHRYMPWGDPMKHTRLWFQSMGKHLPHGAEGHIIDAHATPVALDMWTEGGTHMVAEAEGYFAHTGTQHHGPVAPPGKTAAVAYHDFDRAWSWGPRYPDIVLKQVWDH